MSTSRFAVAEAGIDDEIIAIGEFQALGASKHMVEGATLGGFVGSLLPGGKDMGNLVGAVAGQQAGARYETSDADGNYRWLLAVSPTKLYVLVSANPDAGLKSQAKDMLAGAVKVTKVFDRADLEITVKARVAVRLLTIEDHATGEKMELEGVRHGRYHATDVIHALTRHEDEAEPANA